MMTDDMLFLPFLCHFYAFRFVAPKNNELKFNQHIPNSYLPVVVVRSLSRV